MRTIQAQGRLMILRPGRRTSRHAPDGAANPALTPPGDVQEALKAVFAETLQTLLEGELNTHLGYGCALKL